MTEHAVTFKFKDGDKEKAEYYASEADRDLIVQFLEYFKEKEIVYMDGTDYDGLIDLIADLKDRHIENEILTISSSEFWGLHSFFTMHENRTRGFKEVSAEDFFTILKQLQKAFYIVLTPQAPVEE